MHKRLFVLRVDDYRPDLCRYTLPTIRAYAEKIGAVYTEITERAFPGYPVTYEKLQVHRLGAGAKWNILVDADTMLHPDLPDFTVMLRPDHVGFASGHDIQAMFKPNPYFLRCGHSQAIASGLVITSELTHDLWEPLAMTLEEALAQTSRPFILDEYALTYNLARYGLKYTGVMASPFVAEGIQHIGSEERSEEQRAKDVAKAAQLYAAWGFIGE